MFQELGREELDLHAFFEMLDAHTPAAQGDLLLAIEALVRRGWLREAGNDFYTITEAGRAGWTGRPRNA